MWVIFICSALTIVVLTMVLGWIGFKMWLKAKKEIKKFEKEND